MLYIILFFLVIILVILISINITLFSKSVYGGEIFDKKWANEQGWNYHWWDWYYMDTQLYDLPKLQYMYKIFIDDTIIFNDEYQNNSIEWFRTTGCPKGMNSKTNEVILFKCRFRYVETMTILDNMLLFSIPYYDYNNILSGEIIDSDEYLNLKKYHIIKYRKQMQKILIDLGASIDNIPDCMFCNRSSHEIYTESSLDEIAICDPNKIELSSQYIIYAIIPDMIKSIGKGAFYACALREISIPKGVSVIQENAFSHNIHLNKIIFEERPPSEDNFLIIENNVFRGCYLSALITIPSFVAAIRYNAFKKPGAGTIWRDMPCKKIKIDTRDAFPLYVDTNTFSDCKLISGDNNIQIIDKNTQLPQLTTLSKPPSSPSYILLSNSAILITEEKSSRAPNLCAR